MAGRVGAWTLPPFDIPLDLVLLDTPWDNPAVPVGEALLRQILAGIGARGGERVGHVIDDPPREPFWQGNPGAATIGYVGVVPEQRGMGYVNDLTAQVTRTLHAAGYTRIVADTDPRNAPMAGAFRRAGYAPFGTRKEFAIELGVSTGQS